MTENITVTITTPSDREAVVTREGGCVANTSEAGGRRAQGTSRPDSEATETGFGMHIEAITPEVAREVELPRNRGGAVVSSVERNSPAANAGVSPGDIILEVNRQPVSNVSQITRALQSANPGTPVFLLIWRNGTEAFIALSKR